MFYSSQHFNGVKNILKLQLLFGCSCIIFAIFMLKNVNGILSAFLGLLLALVPTLVYIKIALS